MIIGSTRIATGGDGRGAMNLERHLLDKPDENEEIEILAGSREDLQAWHSEAELAGKQYGLRHVTISPRAEISDDQAHQIARSYLAEYGREGGRYALVRHEKPRVGTSDAGTHYHLVVPEYDGRRVLSDRHNFIRNNVLAARWETELGEELTPRRKRAGIAAGLEARGYHEAAARERAALQASLDAGEPAPGAAYTAAAAQGAKRQGIKLPAARAEIAQAWASAANPAARVAAIEALGYTVAPGAKEGLWIVTRDEVHIGSLDRLTRTKRGEIDEALRSLRRPTAPAPQIGAPAADQAPRLVDRLSEGHRETLAQAISAADLSAVPEHKERVRRAWRETAAKAGLSQQEAGLAWSQMEDDLESGRYRPGRARRAEARQGSPERPGGSRPGRARRSGGSRDQALGRVAAGQLAGGALDGAPGAPGAPTGGGQPAAPGLAGATGEAANQVQEARRLVSVAIRETKITDGLATRSRLGDEALDEADRLLKAARSPWSVIDLIRQEAAGSRQRADELDLSLRPRL